MKRLRLLTAGKRTLCGALIGSLALTAVACSSTGGKKSEQGTTGVTAGKADTPRMKIAMVTHAPTGDVF